MTDRRIPPPPVASRRQAAAHVQAATATVQARFSRAPSHFQGASPDHRAPHVQAAVAQARLSPVPVPRAAASRPAAPPLRPAVPAAPVPASNRAIQKFGDKLAFKLLEKEKTPEVDALVKIIETERKRKQDFKIQIEDDFSCALMKAQNRKEQYDAMDQYLKQRGQSGWSLDRILGSIKEIAGKLGLKIDISGKVVKISSTKTNSTVLEIYKEEDLYELVKDLGNQKIYRKKGSPKEYVLDSAGVMVPRYVVRYITFYERNRIAEKYGIPQTVTFSTEYVPLILTPRQRGSRATKHEASSFQGVKEGQELDRREQEFMLNRTDTQRLLPVTRTKQPGRSNQMEPFLQHGEKFYRHKGLYGESSTTYGLGGGLVLVDLSKLRQEDIRSQYSATSLKEMKGFGRTGTTEHTSTQPDLEIFEARRSAIRNREIHIGPRIPDSAIIAWSPSTEHDWQPLSTVTGTGEMKKAPSKYYSSNLDEYEKDQTRLRLKRELWRSLAEGFDTNANEEALRKKEKYLHGAMIQTKEEAKFLRGIMVTIDDFEICKGPEPAIYFRGQVCTDYNPLKDLVQKEKESVFSVFPYAALRKDLWTREMGGQKIFFGLSYEEASKAFAALMKRGVLLSYKKIGVQINGNIEGSLKMLLNTVWKP